MRTPIIMQIFPKLKSFVKFRRMKNTDAVVIDASNLGKDKEVILEHHFVSIFGLKLFEYKYYYIEPKDVIENKELLKEME